MKVVDRKRQNEMKAVTELPLGMAYRDKEGVLCIKTREAQSGYCGCLAYVDDEWHEDEEHEYTRVLPITTTLTVED